MTSARRKLTVLCNPIRSFGVRYYTPLRRREEKRREEKRRVSCDALCAPHSLWETEEAVGWEASARRTAHDEPLTIDR